MFDWNSFWHQVRSVAQDLIVDHWVKALVAGTIFLLTVAFGLYRAWWSLRNRTFYRRFHFSLNILTDKMLLIRTVDEMDVDQVMLSNSAASNILIAAAKRTTVEDPFISLPKDQMWLVLNAALNELANKIGVGGWLGMDAGLPVVVENYIIGLTCEKDDDVRIRKIRLMMIKEKSLLDLYQRPNPPLFELRFHGVRWKTLRRMHEIYVDEKRKGEFVRVRKMEVAVPKVA